MQSICATDRSQQKITIKQTFQITLPKKGRNICNLDFFCSGTKGKKTFLSSFSSGLMFTNVQKAYFISFI